MSNCGCYPAIGPNKKLEELLKLDCEPFNPSEIRLYGRPGCEWSPYNEEKEGKEIDLEKTIKDHKNLFETKLKEEGVNLNPGDVEKVLNITSTLIPILSEDIVVFGGPLRFLPISTSLEKGAIQSVGVIYGYAYEGHCYRLPRPQIMFLPETPYRIPEGDCGCDCGYDSKLGYALWRVDKLERVVTLDVRSDDLKTLVLDENLPGKRSPLAYSQVQALAPNRSHD